MVRLRWWLRRAWLAKYWRSGGAAMPLALLLLFGCATAPAVPAPIGIEVCGLPNLSTVYDSAELTVLRSARPTTEQLACLAAYAGPRGGLHVFRLCRPSEGCETDVPGGTLHAYDMPPYTDDMLSIADEPSPELVQALARDLEGIRRGLVLIHCVHGQDRTSLASAVAAVVVGGRTKAQAFDEQAMERHMRPFPGLLRAWRSWRPAERSQMAASPL